MPRFIDAETMPSGPIWDSLSDKERLGVLSYLLSSPTEDVVSVVRCEDCRYYDAGVEYYPDGTKNICRLLSRQMREDGFCHLGEERGD